MLSREESSKSTTQGSTMDAQSIDPASFRNFQQVLVDLKAQDRIFFEKTLKRSSTRNSHKPSTSFLSHGDKFQETVHLVAGPTRRTWSVRLYIQVTRIHNNLWKPTIHMKQGWYDFATFHGLEQNDRLIFALKAMSTFEVYIFHPMGKPKELSFPTSRGMVNEVHEPLREGVNEKSWDSTTNLGGKGKTAAQLVKAQVAQQKNAPKRPWRGRTQQDAIRPEEPLRSALDIFEPHFVHNYPVQSHPFPAVSSQEPPDDVHEEFVMPLAKNLGGVSEDFVEIKITSLGLEDKDHVRTQSPNSPLSFLSPSTFRNFNNLRGNMRVQAVVILNGTPEMNGGAADRASNVLPAVQSDPSLVVQSDPSAEVQPGPSAAVQSDLSAAVQCDPSPIGQSGPSTSEQPWIYGCRRASKHPIIAALASYRGKLRRHRKPWALVEVLTLIECIARCGVGKWADIKQLGFSSNGSRTVVDLKDKWRNLVRACEAQLHPAEQGGRNKGLAFIPAPIMARVRELASVPNQALLKRVYVSNNPSRKWRIVHRM